MTMSSTRTAAVLRSTAIGTVALATATILTVVPAPSSFADRPTGPGSSASARTFDIEQVVSVRKQQRVRYLIAHARELRVFR
jgi:hypothetical protein